MIKMMSKHEAALTLELLKQHNAPDHVIFGVMVGCPTHGNSAMDWDHEAFCHACALNA